MSRDALVVGINTYQNLPGLQAPAQDAEAVARCLESFGECRVVRLPEAITHQKPAISLRGAVTTPMLEQALIKLFKPAGKTIPQTAIFYYSGHGLQRQAGIQEGYLATSDVNPAAGQYGLSLHWLRRLLQESPVRQRVILLDCCNSGEFFNMLEADPGARAGTDRLFMAAAREYEAAYESLDSDYSVFTQALLSGLDPHKVKGGIVNGHSLTDVVNRALKGEPQQPLFESSGGEIVLTRMVGLTAPSPEAPLPLLDRLQKLRYEFCPFPGADPFGAAHSEFFFGRDDITQALVERVQTARLCALVGASGSGKTSILQAGLMPRLAQLEGGVQVRYLALGASPLVNLAEVFVDPAATGLRRAEQLRRAESFLQQGPEGFCQLVQAVADEAPLVLVLDQFEGLLAEGLAPEGERRRVIDCLTTAVERAHLPLRLVLGLRADYLQALGGFPALQALVADHSLAVPTMTYNQLKATIVGPLDRVGLRYDANLVYTLLLDVVSAPANLALLQLTLKELWSRREITLAAPEPPCLTLATYAEMGGLRHLLSERASRFYQSLSAAEQAIAQRIFLSFCDLSDGVALTSRRVSLAELVTATLAEADVSRVLEQLIAARIVVAQAPAHDAAHDSERGSAPLAGRSPEAADGDLPLVSDLLVTHAPCPATVPYFDIAHEALIRNWSVLQQWLHTQGPIVRQQRHIEVAAQAWQQQRQPNHPDFFLTKTRLNQAQAFRQAHPEQLSLLASRYLEACDRYNRRCCQRRHLVRLLIPLSMATGMLTAYAHSYVTRPSTALTPLQAEPAVVEPSFELLAPTGTQPPETQPDDLPLGLGSPQVGSQLGPQAGVVRNDLLRLMPRAGQNPQPALESLASAPQLRSALAKSARGLEPLETAAKALQPAPSAALAQGSAQPLANQVVELESSWVSPENPTLILQIWCTRSGAESVCFTTTAARGS